MKAVNPTTRTPLRVGIVRAAIGLVLASLAVFVASLYLFVYLPLRHDLAFAQLRIVSEQVEGRLRTLVDRVEAIARMPGDWGRRGLLDIDQPERFNEVVSPLIVRLPQVSSIVVARETGQELLLLHPADHRWVIRLTDPAVSGRRARFLTWNDRGQLVAEEVSEVDYDARRRPWFQGAMALAGDDAVFWTAPYVFLSTQEPGMSAVLRWTAPDGRRHVLGANIRLIDLSRFTRDIVVGKAGFVAVFAADGNLIGVPRDTRSKDDVAIKAAVLKPLEHSDSAALSEAVRRWRSAGAHAGAPLSFDVQGTPWVATFAPAHFGSQTFWVATMAPEADFFPASPAQAAMIALLVSLTLLLAWIGAARLARHLSRPLELLADHSQRIGRLELDRPADVDTTWVELDALARAQEAMRVELLAATLGLSDANSQLEARVRERTQQLAEAKDAADAANRAKAEFLANMSHEIRTPMNAILGMTDLALCAAPDERQRGYLIRVRAAADSLLGVIDDILDFSKIEAGKLEMERAEFSLQGVLDRVAQVIGQRAEHKGLDLLMHGAADVPATLVGDALRLEQVLVNLGTNAVKFTTQGAVVVSVTRLRREETRVRLHFSVRDTGVGLSAEQIAGLFQAFKQVDASTTRKYGGTGLGLAICRRLVAMMGGEIGVDSQPGRGSDFHFSAEFGVGHAADMTTALAPAPRPGDGEGTAAVAPPQLKGLSVLLVEDNDFNQVVAFEFLTAVAAMQVTIAGNGREALDLLREAQFDIVLMDVQMPVMDGLEAAAAIRRDPRHVRLPIIAMTAHAMAGDREQCLAAGMNDYVSKPFDPSVLFAVMATWLGPQAGMPTGGSPGGGDVEQGLSFDFGLRRSMGRKTLYDKLLRRFAAAHARAPDAIGAAVAAGERAQAAALAHNIAPNAWAIGADALSRAARALQQALDNGDAQAVRQWLETFEREHAIVWSRLEPRLGGDAPAAA